MCISLEATGPLLQQRRFPVSRYFERTLPRALQAACTWSSLLVYNGTEMIKLVSFRDY